MSVGIATFGSGTTSGIPISGSLGPSTQTIQTTAPTSYYQDSAPTSDQYGTLLPTYDSSGQVLGDSTGSTSLTADQIAAQQAAQAETQRLADGTALFNTQLGVIDSSASNAGTQSSGDLKNSILDYIDSLAANQTGRNNQQVDNYLAKQQGAQSITDMVGQGIRSGGVMLNNKNAGDSSAAGALANAYGQIGRGQLSSVGNQFAQAQNKIKQGHDADAVALGNKLRDLPQVQSDVVNSIVNDAQQKLGALDQQMAYMSLPDRVDMEAQKQQITNDVLAKLQGLDQLLSNQGNQALTPEAESTALQKAGSLFSAGAAPSNAFQFSTDVPTAFQNTGPYAGNLPIFTLPSKKQTA